MKKTSIATLVLFVISVLSFSTILAQDAHKYVGVKKCGMCHKKDNVGNQLKIWKGSKHANAFKTLQSEKADKIAAEKGFKTKAAETPECLACHTTGSDLDAAMLGKNYKIEEGVQCETCHGAGDKYKSKKVMKDHGKSVAAGMAEYKDLKAVEAQCVTCHNKKSPTFKAFDFEKKWAKVQHPAPKK